MSTFTLKRGLSNIHIAEITADTEEKYETGTPEKLIPAGEMSISVDKDAAQYWFDNTVFATVGREGASEITISGAGLRAAAIAKINGKRVDDETGAVIDSGEWNEKYFALGAETENIDGTKEFVWFAKGTFAIPDESHKTKGEDTDATGTELTFSAIPTIHLFADGENKKPCKRVVIDTETTKLKTEQDWFAQVVTPDNLGTIAEKVSA